MLIICDFDGTVTARDTNSHLARRFAPDAFDQLEGRLAKRELTLREVLAAEFADIRVGRDAVVEAALEVPTRPGFASLVAAARHAGAEVILLSSGFRQLIEPILRRDGLDAGVPLVANDIELDERGGRITWRELPTCGLCGEPCKRHDVERMRAGDHHDGRSFDEVVFVGDGFSDRCGAEAADRIFARDALAAWLDDQQVGWEPWRDFDDVRVSLGLGAAS